MAYIGGDITEITCSHPDLGDYRFSPKSNESFKFDTGGLRNNDDKNSITADGVLIVQKNRVVWSLEGAIAVDLTTEYEKLAIDALMESPVLGTWTVTHVSGAIYKGDGIPVGDFEIDTNAASTGIKIHGSGKMEKI